VLFKYAGAHLIDQALTLFGPPSALTAHMLNQRQLPDSHAPDAFTVTLHYEPPSPHAHLTAILRASMLTQRPGPRFLLHGDLGSFEKRGLDAQEAQLRAGLAPTDPGGARCNFH
jgi:scyllo-inositol 2-dehydrogenase (NADP+)